MRWIWRALTRRLLLKFIALLCACVLWVYVDSTLLATREIAVPVTVEWLKGDVEVSSESIVRVRVRGPAEQLALARISARHVRLPEGFREKTYRVELSEDDFHFASDETPTIIGVEPREVVFDIK